MTPAEKFAERDPPPLIARPTNQPSSAAEGRVVGIVVVVVVVIAALRGSDA
jgi:hypothetical protein